MQIDWNPPPPRNGWLGHWDRFMGPGATDAEDWLQLGGGLVLAALCVWVFFWRYAGTPTWLQIGLVGLFALDLSGGIITNATTAAKRWYHRSGQTWRQHLIFVAPHGIHIGLLAWAFPGLAPWFFPVIFGYLLLATVLIMATPLYLQRPLAFTLFAASLLLNLIAVPVTGLEWVIPFLMLKLLIAHLVKEAPFRPSDSVAD